MRPTAPAPPPLRHRSAAAPPPLFPQHNLLYNASYSSFTIGWGWGREASRRGGNTIRANRVLGSQLGRCCDGGGIYTLGPQPGSAITGNYIAQGSAASGPHAG